MFFSDILGGSGWCMLLERLNIVPGNVHVIQAAGAVYDEEQQQRDPGSRSTCIGREGSSYGGKGLHRPGSTLPRRV
jgi:hypothetical protein